MKLLEISFFFLSRSSAAMIACIVVTTSIFAVIGYDQKPVKAEKDASIRFSQMNIPCVVSLKKGRKLVIRDRNGKRLSATLANGTKVTAVEMADGDGPGAAEIAVTRGNKQVVMGWVSQADLKCKFD